MTFLMVMLLVCSLTSLAGVLCALAENVWCYRESRKMRDEALRIWEDTRRLHWERQSSRPRP